MKALLIFIVCFLVGSSIMLEYHYGSSLFKGGVAAKPPITTKFSLANAPSESLRGEIASMSGTVEWLSRTAANSVQVKNGQQIMQGEDITTGKNGKAVVRIQNDASLLLYPNTHVSIIQLLPGNFVFLQDKGSVDYENTVSTPVSVRTLDLVSLLNNGIAKITVDSDDIVTISVEKGVITEGFEDTQNTSNVVMVKAGQTYVFDDTIKDGTVEGEPIQQNNGLPL
jgi:hypothetical protein